MNKIKNFSYQPEFRRWGGKQFAVCAPLVALGAFFIFIYKQGFGGTRLRKENCTSAYKRENFTQHNSATSTWPILLAHIISEQTAFQNKKRPNKT